MPSDSRPSNSKSERTIMKKLLIISPHFSTGGAPAVTLNKVKLLVNDFQIKVVEHSFLSWIHVVQRNEVMSIVGQENFVTLGDNKKEQLLQLISDFAPDVISMEEFPEFFMQDDLTQEIYRSDRTYTILETTHDSSFHPRQKRFFPDRFVFVSSYCAFKYNMFDIPMEVIEYPVEKKEVTKKIENRDKLGLEHDFKHIIIVGLFTPRKNQKYAFELAERLYRYHVKFHFLGNLASNFESYWKPLIEWKKSTDKLDNCVIWDERSDVPDFVQAADMFLFCSKGDRNNKELNPIAIKEAMEYDIPKLMYNLDVYCNKYNDKEDVHYLTGDLETDAQKIISILKLDLKRNEEEAIIIGTYPNLQERVRLTKDCIKRAKALGRKIILLSHYPVDEETQKLVDYYVYDAYNPLTHHSYYTRFYNYQANYDADININGLKNSNQSLTVLTNLYNGFKLAKAQGFKRAFYLTFDILLQSEDLQSVEHSFKAIDGKKKAYLASLNTPFGKGIQTNGMTFDVDYFLDLFDDVREPEEYNKICEQRGSQNFLEDYFIKCINDVHESSVEIVHNPEETFLKKSGLGVSSNSEYYSILPIQGQENHFMFYFFSYNLDERKINVTLIEDGVEIFNTRFQVNKMREYKKDFVFAGKPIELILDFYDGDRNYKSERYEVKSSNLEKYKHTGYFKWKNKKPKIKLVHLQITNDEQRQKESRESLGQVRHYGWEYNLHTNVPYSDLPPKFNCIRPDCVSMDLFDDATAQRLGTALTPSHYGCFDSFRNAILSEFDSDIDYLMVCEGDCILEVDVKEFVEKVERSCEFIESHKIGYMSYGDKDTLEHGWRQSPIVEEIPNQDLMYVTNHLIGIQSIMFPKWMRGYLKEQFRTHPWDAADIFLNTIIKKGGYKMGIVHERLTTQADGFSLIDKQFKTFRKR
jgi:glycosyltransferase involved in cell wall biosynthesis